VIRIICVDQSDVEAGVDDRHGSPALFDDLLHAAMRRDPGGGDFPRQRFHLLHSYEDFVLFQIVQVFDVERA
jgi:hypothetical protein